MLELIYDKQGKLRDCPSNRLILGYWRSLWYFHGYVNVIQCTYFEEVVKAFKVIVSLILWVMLFPLLPFIHCHFRQKAAKRYKEQAAKDRWAH